MIKMTDYIMYDSLLGLTIEEAEEKLAKYKVRIRVTSYNGDGMVGTCDMDNSRLNVEVEHDKISKIIGRG